MSVEATTCVLMAMLCICYIAKVFAEKLDGNSLAKKTQQSNQRMMAIGESATLIVTVQDDGDKASVTVYPETINMQDVAFAAAFLTCMAAKRCEDGFERGLEYIQDDAMQMAADK